MVALLPAVVSGLLLFDMMMSEPDSILAVMAVVVFPPVFGASIFLMSFLVLQFGIIGKKREEKDEKSESQYLKMTALTRKIEDEMNKTLELQGYAARNYVKSEEANGDLVVFKSHRFTPRDSALNVPEALVSALNRPELLVPYIYTSIRLNKNVRGFEKLSKKTLIVMLPLLLGLVLLLPIIVGGSFFETFPKVIVPAFIAWLVMVFVWTIALVLKHMRNERGIDQEAEAMYPEFHIVLRMLIDSGFSAAYGHPSFKKRLRRLGLRESEPQGTGYGATLE
jgi:hypothetical protein